MPEQEPHSSFCRTYLSTIKLLTEQPCMSIGLSASTHNPRTNLDILRGHPCSINDLTCS